MMVEPLFGRPSAFRANIETIWVAKTGQAGTMAQADPHAPWDGKGAAGGMSDWRNGLRHRSGWLIGIVGLIAWFGMLWGMFGDVL